jgi:hypothetical protein
VGAPEPITFGAWRKSLPCYAKTVGSFKRVLFWLLCAGILLLFIVILACCLFFLLVILWWLCGYGVVIGVNHGQFSK